MSANMRREVRTWMAWAELGDVGRGGGSRQVESSPSAWGWAGVRPDSDRVPTPRRKSSTSTSTNANTQHLSGEFLFVVVS